MKKTICIIATVSLFGGLLFQGCNSPYEKVENAKDKVEEANKDLNAANIQYEEDYLNYKKESNDKILANEQSVIDFKARIENQKEAARAEYNEKINLLEKKNSDLKKKLEEYKAHGKDHWESFKTEFNHDMDELGRAFKDLTVNNVKK